MKTSKISVIFVLLTILLVSMVSATNEMNGVPFNGAGSWTFQSGAEIEAKTDFVMNQVLKDGSCGANTYYIYDTSTSNSTEVATASFGVNVNYSILSGHRYLLLGGLAAKSGSFNPDQANAVTMPITGTVADWTKGILSYDFSGDARFNPNVWCISGFSYTLACTPNWSCNGYDSCLINDTHECNSVTDLNTCGGSYSGDYSEFTSQACDYCTPSIVNTTWSSWINQTSCRTNDTYIQNRSRHDYDESGCYAITGLGSDLHTNVTYVGTQSLSCDYCTPDWSCSLFGGACELFKAGCTAAEDANDCYADTGLASDQYSDDYSEFGIDTCGATSHSSGAAHQALITPKTASEPEQKGTAFNIFGGEKFNFLAWLDNAIISFKKLVGLQK